MVLLVMAAVGVSMIVYFRRKVVVKTVLFLSI